MDVIILEVNEILEAKRVGVGRTSLPMDDPECRADSPLPLATIFPDSGFFFLASKFPILPLDLAKALAFVLPSAATPDVVGVVVVVVVVVDDDVVVFEWVG
jgi:hypothetical protein